MPRYRGNDDSRLHMNKATALKILKCLLALIALSVLAIHGEMRAHRGDLVYPLLILPAVAYLHWFSWQLFFDYLGVPGKDTSRIAREIKLLAKGYYLDTALAGGYFFTAFSVSGFFFPETIEFEWSGLKYGLILLTIGVLGKMLAAVRLLVFERYRGGSAHEPEPK
jgi:hypothetical protein